MNITQRVEQLRQWMRNQNIRAYIIPTADPHNNEYIPAHWMCREWISGFTGSAGLAIVTETQAALWTDSRYWLQAEEQLAGSPFVLMREGDKAVPAPAQWLADCFKEQNLALQAHCPSQMLTLDMQAEARQAGIDLCGAPDAFDELWTNRPELPAALIEVQPLEWAGVPIADKLHTMACTLNEVLDGRTYIFNDLSDIAWLLNLRGNDIPYNPVFMAYLTYEPQQERFTLFTHTHTLTKEAYSQLEKAGVALADYNELERALQGKRIAFGPQTVSTLKAPGQGGNADFIVIPSPAEQLRAVKNEAEQEGFRQAMLRDGVAMVCFLRWLDEQLLEGNRVTECTVDQKLTALRAMQPGFKELSFPTIAAYGPHAAIVHYEAEPDTDAVLEPHGLLLLDSGAQFDCGTTDITRTIALGPLTNEEKKVYTLVLKGHLGLARMHFPEGTTGLQLDLAARRDMWEAGYDFGHGTGHGVGSHLCVHEGPHQIRKNLRPCTLVPFTEGMVVTNEPGIYLSGKLGVRIENVLLCRYEQTTPFGRFMQFENLTLCPYDLRAIDRSLLHTTEVQQINNYHAHVRSLLLPLLTNPADRQWLEAATQPLS